MEYYANVEILNVPLSVVVKIAILCQQRNEVIAGVQQICADKLTLKKYWVVQTSVAAVGS